MPAQPAVAPRAGAWIETNVIQLGRAALASRPARARGLKLVVSSVLRAFCVAPRAGAWIETLFSFLYHRTACVAPRAGAWIETSISSIMITCISRAPRGRVD